MDNAEKNSYVKRRITEALIELLQDKALKDIGIGEIAARAEVSRNSFYRNYETKEDILQDYIEKLFNEWGDEYHKRGIDDNTALMGAMFAHLTAYRAFYLLLSRRNLLPLLKSAILHITGPRPELSNIEAYAAAFIAYALYGWIEEWIHRGMQESAEEMMMLLRATGFGGSGGQAQ